MRIVFILLLLSGSLNTTLLAQSCGCNFTITASSSYLVDGVSMNIQPGDTICIMAGTRTNLTFRNLAGTSSLPIVIKNCGGKATISTLTSYGIKFERSHHFKLTGTGSADSLGLEVKNSYHGIFLGDFTSDFEIDHVEIHDITFAGIMAKTDPLCADTMTWRENFTMRNVNILHNYIYNTVNGEGMYIGYSMYANGITCGTKTAYAHAIENITVAHNKTYNTGCEGIQIGCAVSGCVINDNSIEAFGQRPFAGSGQQNGIQIGEGTGGLCYNNFVKADSLERGSNGIIVLGLGDNILYNNVIINPGAAGLFIDERPPALITGVPVTGYWVVHNTIINPGTDGIKTYAELVDKNEFKNNIIVNPASTKYINSTGGPGTPNVVQGNNYLTTSISSPGFVNYAFNNFRLLGTSSCVDAAENGAHWNIFKDHSGLTRPKGVAFDIGAFEHDTTLQNQPPVVFAGNDTIIYTPQDTLIINGTVSDPDGLIDTHYWLVDSPGTLTIVQTNQLNTVVKNLEVGINKIKLVAIDNGNKQSEDELIVEVLEDLRSNVNIQPKANAGKNVTISLKQNPYTIAGTGTDADGSIVSYNWTLISGKVIKLTNTNSANLTISDFQTGYYVFRLTVTDNKGATASDNITIKVKK